MDATATHATATQATATQATATEQVPGPPGPRTLLQRRDVVLLQAVAETGIVRDAARVVGCSASAAGRSLEQLERRIGVPLLHCNDGGICLTPAGRAVLTAGERYLAGTRDAPELGADEADILRAVRDTGSLNRAASRVLITQPALTRRLARVERRLGLTLLLRDRGGSTLTPSARRLLERITDAEAQLQRTLLEIRRRYMRRPAAGETPTTGTPVALAKRVPPQPVPIAG